MTILRKATFLIALVLAEMTCYVDCHMLWPHRNLCHCARWHAPSCKTSSVGLLSWADLVVRHHWEFEWRIRNDAADLLDGLRDFLICFGIPVATAVLLNWCRHAVTLTAEITDSGLRVLLGRHNVFCSDSVLAVVTLAPHHALNLALTAGANTQSPKSSCFQRDAVIAWLQEKCVALAFHAVLSRTFFASDPKFRPYILRWCHWCDWH
jgi:hypothetical protein